MKIAILGAQGRLGSYLTYGLKKHDVFPLSRFNVDTGSLDSITKILNDISPDLLVNCINRFHAKSSDFLFIDNTVSATNLAVYCSQYDVGLVHFSCASVIANSDIKDVSADLLPDDEFAESRAEAEYNIQKIFLAESFEKYKIVRIGELFDKNGLNLRQKVARQMQRSKKLELSINEFYSIISREQILKNLQEQIDNESVFNKKLEHWYDKGAVSMFDIAKTIKSEMGFDCDLFSKQIPKKNHGLA